MSIYPQRISEKISEPAESLPSREATALGRAASFVCGSFAEAAILMERSNSTVERLVLATNGCGFMTAACRVIEEMFTGRELASLQRLDPSIISERIAEELGEFPLERVQCAAVAVESLTNAFKDLRAKKAAEFSGDSPLICTCFGVTEEDIENATLRARSRDLDDLRAFTRAGTGCGACRALIEDVLEKDQPHEPQHLDML